MNTCNMLEFTGFGAQIRLCVIGRFRKEIQAKLGITSIKQLAFIIFRERAYYSDNTLS